MAGHASFDNVIEKVRAYPFYVLSGFGFGKIFNLPICKSPNNTNDYSIDYSGFLKFRSIALARRSFWLQQKQIFEKTALAIHYETNADSRS